MNRFKLTDDTGIVKKNVDKIKYIRNVFGLKRQNN